MSDRRVAKGPVNQRSWQCAGPAVVWTASRFLTRSDLIGSEFRPINTWFLGIFVWA